MLRSKPKESLWEGVITDGLLLQTGSMFCFELELLSETSKTDRS